jgi:hypothetical protein
VVAPQLNLSSFFLDLSFKRVLGTLAGFRKIGVCAICLGMWVAVRKLAVHGVVAGLRAVVGLERTFFTVGIVFEVIGSMVGHG